LPRGEASTLINLGLLLRTAGQRAAAQAAIEQGLALARRIEDVEMVVRALSNIGALHHDRGDFIVAGKQLREAQAIMTHLDNPSLRRMLLLDLGQIAEKAGRPGWLPLRAGCWLARSRNLLYARR